MRVCAPSITIICNRIVGDEPRRERDSPPLIPSWEQHKGTIRMTRSSEYEIRGLGVRQPRTTTSVGVNDGVGPRQPAPAPSAPKPGK